MQLHILRTKYLMLFSPMNEDYLESADLIKWIEKKTESLFSFHVRIIR